MKESGFTIIELLLALAVTSVITMTTFIVFHQLTTGTSRNSTETAVLDNLHSVSLPIKKDLQAHSTANFTDLQSGNVTLSWTDETGFAPVDERNHTRIYSLSETGDLIRTSDNTTGIIGRNITNVIFTLNGDYVDVVIMAESGGYPSYTDNLSFSVYKRTEEIE